MLPAGLAYSLRFLRRLAHSSSADLPRPQSHKGTDDSLANNKPKPQGENELNNEPRFIRLQKDFELYQLMEGPKMVVPLNKCDALRYYRQLLAVRHLETAASNLYKERLIRGFCHLNSGQEACAVGIWAAMGQQDKLISGYRIHGWACMMSVSARGILAELNGRTTGCSGGKVGSMHMYVRNFHGENLYSGYYKGYLRNVHGQPLKHIRLQ